MADGPKTDGRFDFDNTFAREMAGLYVDWNPVEVPSPETVIFNSTLSRQLRLGLDASNLAEVAQLLSGNVLSETASPLAQAYAGHQFGGFVPQLGDGRAVLLGEVIGTDGRRYDIQLKGSGRTPFSRGGDGKASLGPMLREYLMCEALYALGIPTTRALAVVKTGESVYRESALPGAVLTRVASSHIRVGTFQFFAARRDTEKLKYLADYAIRRHYPTLAGSEDEYLKFFEAVLQAQASLLTKWMLVGFVHGVMNTDNMTISGESIDYGPCAFIDEYDPNAVFSSIDTGGRYAYANQPLMAQWNLARFAESLIPLVDDDASAAADRLKKVLDSFPEVYLAHWLPGMQAKLGLLTSNPHDLHLINDLYQAMDGQGVDFTQFFRSLSSVARGNREMTRSLFKDQSKIEEWLDRYEKRLSAEEAEPSRRADAMDAVNPIYIPRNHKVEEALSAAVENDDLAPFHKLNQLLSKPFLEQPGVADFAEPAPDGSPPHVTFCGT